jgi:prevent-host-death family protein
MDAWKLQDAKARFSEVVDRALRDGPQVVTRHRENAVVVVAYREFVRAEPSEDFKAFLRAPRGASPQASEAPAAQVHALRFRLDADVTSERKRA